LIRSAHLPTYLSKRYRPPSSCPHQGSQPIHVRRKTCRGHLCPPLRERRNERARPHGAAERHRTSLGRGGGRPGPSPGWPGLLAAINPHLRPSLAIQRASIWCERKWLLFPGIITEPRGCVVNTLAAAEQARFRPRLAFEISTPRSGGGTHIIQSLRPCPRAPVPRCRIPLPPPSPLRLLDQSRRQS